MLSRLELTKQLADFVNRIGDGSVFQYKLHLFNINTNPVTLDSTYLDIGSFECDFLGYAPVPLTSLDFLAPANDGDTVHVDTVVKLFAFNSAGSGLNFTTNADTVALVRTNVSTSAKDLMDLVSIGSVKTFLADGDLFETRYRRVALTCEE